MLDLIFGALAIYYIFKFIKFCISIWIDAGESAKRSRELSERVRKFRPDLYDENGQFIG